jgi:hypothetical protein
MIMGRKRGCPDHFFQNERILALPVEAELAGRILFTALKMPPPLDIM